VSRSPPPRRRRIVRLAAVLVLACTGANPAYQPEVRKPDAEPAPDDLPRDAAPADSREPDPIDGRSLVADAPESPEAPISLPELAPPAADVGPDLPSGPRTLTMNPGSVTDFHGGTAGNSHSQLCPAQQALTGYRGTVGMTSNALIVVSLQAECGALVVNGSNPYTVAIGTRSRLINRGGSAGSTAFTAICPGNQVLSGFSGRSGDFLDQLQLHCVPLTIDGATLAVTAGPSTPLPASGGPGGLAFQSPCPVGQVARGQLIGDGDGIDELAFQCGILSVVP
jgi:hypothetical protein